jgi:hypothetical protein
MDFDTVQYYKAANLVGFEDLKQAALMKLEIASQNYYDMFKITALAFGNSVDDEKSPSRKTREETLPKADFSTMSTFIGAM